MIGFPAVDEFGSATNISVNTSGNGTMIYDMDAALGFRKTFPVTVEVQIPGYPTTLKRSQNIIIENEA